MDNYSYLDRLFHRLVLSSEMLGEALFDLDRHIYSEHQKIKIREPVFVTGLARAGTTTLMRALHASGEFSSLTYNDMPMVLAPNFWRRLSSISKKNVDRHERAHGDGVLVDADSPEALEEVYWRTFHGREYIYSSHLTKHEINQSSWDKFITYQALVCLRYGKNRYLSKNNNNVVRIADMARFAPDAVFLVPFRNPLSQAQSLLNQHKRFSDGSEFQKQYMTWLVHHEFGATHRPFRLLDRTSMNLDINHIDYWLNVWIEVYGYVLKIQSTCSRNIVPVCFERLCGFPDYWQSICGLVSITTTDHEQFRPATEPTSVSANTSLVEEASNIYQQLDRAHSSLEHPIH